MSDTDDKEPEEKTEEKPEPQPIIQHELLSERLQFLLTVYLSQHIEHPITIEPNQLAYRWVGGYSGRLIPITPNFNIGLDDLKGIDKQKAKVIQNTKQFLAGFPANHVLMIGEKGSGKSSMIRALLKEFSKNGMRVIEVTREDLLVLHKIREAIIDMNGLISGHGCHYIIYCDDLAFDQKDENYRTLKSALDGALDSELDNMLIYATSNRSHPVVVDDDEDSDEKEEKDSTGDDADDDDIVDEVTSLADRFGLYLTFEQMSQKTYLEVSRHYIEAQGMDWDIEVQDNVLQWASERGGGSGRIAYQFSRQYIGTVKLSGKQELNIQKTEVKKEEEEVGEVEFSIKKKFPLLTAKEIEKMVAKSKLEGALDDKQIFMIVAISTIVLGIVVFSITKVFV